MGRNISSILIISTWMVHKMLTSHISNFIIATTNRFQQVTIGGGIAIALVFLGVGAKYLRAQFWDCAGPAQASFPSLVGSQNCRHVHLCILVGKQCWCIVMHQLPRLHLASAVAEGRTSKIWGGEGRVCRRKVFSGNTNRKERYCTNFPGSKLL